MITKLLLTALLLLLPVSSWAAVIGHKFVERNTTQTTTSTSYVDVTDAAIADGDLVDGKKYLLVYSAFVNENSTGSVRVKMVHGSTDFAESECILNLGGTNREPCGFVTVWTAVAAEGIKLQWLVSTGTAAIDFIAIQAIKLSDDLVENTDWCSAERTTDDALSATPVDGASCTITPSGASDWLVLSYAQYDQADTTTYNISRIERSGEASSSTPEARKLKANTGAVPTYLLARAYALGAASNTFKEVSLATATANTRLHSRIFVLNMNKFRNHAFQYNDADEALSATDYDTPLATASITPDVASDVWIVSYWGADLNSTNREYESRIQVDGSDQPAGQTTANYQFHGSPDAETTPEEPHFHHTMVTNMTAAAHTIDLDGSVDATTSTPAGQHRLVAAFTMELASTGGASRRRNF